MKTMNLCGACAAKLGTAYSVRKIARGVDHKVTCAENAMVVQKIKDRLSELYEQRNKGV